MNRFTDSLWYWRIAIIKVASGCVKVGLLAYLSGTSTRNWSELGGDGQVTVIVSAIIAMQTIVETFCDSTLSDLRKTSGGSNPTAFVKKE